MAGNAMVSVSIPNIDYNKSANENLETVVNFLYSFVKQINYTLQHIGIEQLDETDVLSLKKAFSVAIENTSKGLTTAINAKAGEISTEITQAVATAKTELSDDIEDVDSKFAGYTTNNALATTLSGYATNNALNTAVDGCAKPSDLAGYVSKSSSTQTAQGFELQVNGFDANGNANGSDIAIDKDGLTASFTTNNVKRASTVISGNGITVNDGAIRIIDAEGDEAMSFEENNMRLFYDVGRYHPNLVSRNAYLEFTKPPSDNAGTAIQFRRMTSVYGASQLDAAVSNVAGNLYIYAGESIEIDGNESVKIWAGTEYYTFTSSGIQRWSSNGTLLGSVLT